MPGRLVPEGCRRVLALCAVAAVPEENEYKKVLARNGAAEFGVTAMQAIGSIYDQVEMTKPKGRRSR